MFKLKFLSAFKSTENCHGKRAPLIDPSVLGEISPVTGVANCCGVYGVPEPRLATMLASCIGQQLEVRTFQHWSIVVFATTETVVSGQDETVTLIVTEWIDTSQVWKTRIDQVLPVIVK
jgi:hypothetical protein